ncbi:MAG: hypothetical protein SFV19_00990 [Rhodospirillaceae bacterium]|nr:hypothetical protein [Rhodospirillaceae bacterium]
MIDSYDLTLWFHVAVMGYWLGSDFVLNALTHYFKNAHDLPVAQRMKLWDFLLLVDQHPRNALILSIPLGFQLAADLDLSPIKGPMLAALWVASIAWFVFIWVLHFQVGKPGYRQLNKMDLTLRYSLIVVLFVVGAGSVLGEGPLAAKWLGAKVALFALIIAGGMAIRHYIAQVYAVFPKLTAQGSTPEVERVITHALNWGSYVLFGMWGLIFVIGYLGAAKPF